MSPTMTQQTLYTEDENAHYDSSYDKFHTIPLSSVARSFGSVKMQVKTKNKIQN